MHLIKEANKMSGVLGKLAIQPNIVRHRGETPGVTSFWRLDMGWLNDQDSVTQGCWLYLRLLLIVQFGVGRHLIMRTSHDNHLDPTLWLNATELFAPNSESNGGWITVGRFQLKSEGMGSGLQRLASTCFRLPGSTGATQRFITRFDPS